MNIKELSKRFHKAIIYGHMDLDGITSAIAMKEYLKRYNIETVEFQPIQYGNLEYSISKPQSDDVLPVLVDFAHSKVFIKIHTDHHDNQISYDNSIKNFRHSESNAETISSLISPTNIFSMEDIRIINMIDSAGFKKEDVDINDMIQAVLKTDKEKSAWKNHLHMGMVVGKLLLTYKNKKGFLEEVVMKSKPSLISMYSVITDIMRDRILSGEKGWVTPREIEKNGVDYYKQQMSRKIDNGTIDNITNLQTGSALRIGDCVFQIGAGNIRKTGMYDRYTVFRLYKDVKYMVMCWDSLGMIQVSKNPWAETDELNLGELVINDIFDKKYKKLLKNIKYNISLLAIKKFYESSIKYEDEDKVVGFDFNELIHLFDNDYSHLTEKQQHVLRKWMDWKPSNFKKIENQENIEIDKAINFLNNFKISLPEVIEKISGGHPSITNLSGFNFIEVQKRIDRAIWNGENPMDRIEYKKPEKDDDSKSVNRYDKTSVKIMKSICKDIISALNKNEGN